MVDNKEYRLHAACRLIEAGHPDLALYLLESLANDDPLEIALGAVLATELIQHMRPDPEPDPDDDPDPPLPNEAAAVA